MDDVAVNLFFKGRNIPAKISVSNYAEYPDKCRWYVRWKIGDAFFHVYIKQTDDGKFVIGETLFKTVVLGQFSDGREKTVTRYLNIHAKSWASIYESLCNLPVGLFETARLAAIEEIQAKRRQREEKIAQMEIQTMMDLAKKHGYIVTKE